MKRTLLALVLLLAAATPALAQPGAPVDPYAGRAAPHDDRGDHARGRGKARAARRAQMKRAIVARFDQDGDGRLTGAERQAARQFVKEQRAERRLRALQRLDTNRDGWLSPDEMQRAGR